jgi:hypothetical protein
MNPILMQLLKMLAPMMESAGLQEWQSVGLPKVKALAMDLKVGEGQEEALILADALDKIVQFEAKRQIP